MRLPNKKELWNKQKERKFKYDKSDIDEIVLGFLFFDHNYVIDYSNDIATYDFTLSRNRDDLTGLLDYLVVNSDIKISLIHLQNDLELKLTKRQISISKNKDNVYNYERLE